MKELNVLILCGGTGSGKTFIKEMLCGPNCKARSPLVSNEIIFHSPIQVTTRPKRLGESADSYIFYTKEEFAKLREENLLTANTFYNEEYYGTLISNLIFGKNVYNVIVASREGTLDVTCNLEYCIKKINPNCKLNLNIYTALVLSHPDDGLINEHGRDIQFFKDELFNLLKDPYDFYIPNYEEKRASLTDVLNIFGFKEL